MNSIIESLFGMNTLSDQVIATDLLISSKAGVRNYAFAITEAATPQVKAVLRKQLKEAIEMHGELTNYMINKGWYHPYNANQQLLLDLKTVNTALNITDPRRFAQE